jgi:hypothetical protein
LITSQLPVKHFFRTFNKDSYQLPSPTSPSSIRPTRNLLFVMEVAGLAMAVSSLLAKTSLEGYRIVSSLRSFKEDFGRLHYQLEIEHTKLKDWLNKAIDASDASISSKSSEMSTTDQGRVRLIASTFVRIAQLFADVRQMESLYGVRVTMDHVTKATENPRKGDLLNPGRLLRHVRSTSKNSMSIDVPKVPGTLLIYLFIYLFPHTRMQP